MGCGCLQGVLDMGVWLCTGFVRYAGVAVYTCIGFARYGSMMLYKVGAIWVCDC